MIPAKGLPLFLTLVAVRASALLIPLTHSALGLYCVLNQISIESDRSQ